jgi:hypothetical protein
MKMCLYLGGNTKPFYEMGDEFFPDFSKSEKNYRNLLKVKEKIGNMYLENVLRSPARKKLDHTDFHLSRGKHTNWFRKGYKKFEWLCTFAYMCTLL